MRLLCLIAILLVASLQAFEEYNSLEEALATANSDTLVIFDIDDTVIRPTHMVACTDWGYHVTRQFIAAGMDPIDAFWKSTHQLMTANLFAKMRTVEPDTAAQILSLQEKGCMVIALTSRPSKFAELTRRQLSSVSVDFSLTAPDLPDFALPIDEPIPLYSQGVIYTYQVNKGASLTEFLRVTGLHPKRIIFLDDSQKNAERVETAMGELGIECLSVRYGAADPVRAQFDPEIADFQWEMYGTYLSDDQARILLGKAA